MKNKKKIAMTLSAGILAIALTGCSYYSGYDSIINKKGSGTFSITSGLDKASFNGLVEAEVITKKEAKAAMNSMDKMKYDGKTIYYATKSTKFSSPSKLEAILTDEEAFAAAFPSSEDTDISEDGGTVFTYVHVSNNTFYGYPNIGEDNNETLKEMEEEMDLTIYTDFSFTFPTKVKQTNGTVSEDGKTVTWKTELVYSGEALYATTASEAAPKVTTNITKGKIYTKPVTLTTKSGTGTMYINGDLVKSGDVIKKDGKKTLIIMNQCQSQTKIKFTVDTTAPVISGASNNKTYSKNVKLTFKDATSGIKSVTVNGKKLSASQIKNGYTISKNGSYKVVAADKGGLKKTVSFKIKK
ncbi:MAG: hypothetical protein PUB22_07775 [Clostridiales bacterium]|nr:hypothetical protein [Clostridiales bacterium]